LNFWVVKVFINPLVTILLMESKSLSEKRGQYRQRKNRKKNWDLKYPVTCKSRYIFCMFQLSQLMHSLFLKFSWVAFPITYSQNDLEKNAHTNNLYTFEDWYFFLFVIYYYRETLSKPLISAHMKEVHLIPVLVIRLLKVYWIK
jgi:hypothetical protein